MISCPVSGIIKEIERCKASCNAMVAKHIFNAHSNFTMYVHAHTHTHHMYITCKG